MTRHDDRDAARRPASELDRVLGEWLDDGPRRAPEAPVSAAIAFARAHPRRRDPLAFLRPDAMAGRGSAFLALQPTFALLAVGLLLTALIGVGLVGSFLPKASVAPPPIGPTASPASPAPTASPSPTPAPTPRIIELTLDTQTAITDLVTFEDRSLRVLGVTDVSVSSRSDSAPDGSPGITQIDDRTVDVVWVAGPCDGARWRFVLDAAATALDFQPAPPCQGDTVSITRRIRVAFDGPIDAAALAVTVSAPGASPSG